VLFIIHGAYQVVANEDVVNPGYQAHGVWMTWADHVEGLLNGSLAGGYSFTRLENNVSLVAANPELTQLLGAVSTDYYRDFVAAPASASGISTLAGGGEDHEHLMNSDDVGLSHSSFALPCRFLPLLQRIFVTFFLRISDFSVVSSLLSQAYSLRTISTRTGQS
jgi:hypothetical protein